VTRVVAQENTDPWAKAGVMVRSDLGADASHLMLALTPEHGVAFLKRESKGLPTTQPLLSASPAQPWLKLVRQGSTFCAFISTNGLSWDWLGSESISAGTEMFWGLAVSSHDNSRLGTVVLDGVAIDNAPSAPHLQHDLGSGDGLRASYFDGNTGRIVSRVDSTVNFDWDMDSPAAGIGPDFFSVRWEGFLEPQSTELYELHVESDDGARLWLDDQLLIDAWTDHGPTEQTAKLTLEAGHRYSLKLEYFERVGEAIARLLWSSPTIAKQPIPTTQLYSGGLEAPSAGSSPTPAITSDPVELGIIDSVTSPGASRDTQLPLDSAPAPSTSAKTLNPIITGFHTVQRIAGADPVDRLGQWAIEDASIHAVDRRGWLEYELAAPRADIYRVELTGASYNPLDLDSGFYLVMCLDGEDLGRVLLDAGPGRAGTVQLLTPWINAGTHRLRVFWDNVRKGRSLQVTGLDLQALDGPDANGNGLKDWVEDKLARENAIDSAAPPGSADAKSSLPLIYSTISPACLEGRGAFLGMMKIRLANGQELQPQLGAGNRWYVNVPLSPDKPADLEVSFQNGARTEKRRVVWRPTNLLLSDDLLLRRGDSLLLAAQPASPADLSNQAAPNGETAEIEVAGVVVQSALPGLHFVQFLFDQVGPVNLTGTVRGHHRETRTIKATVVTGSFRGSPVAWTGKARVWDCPDLPAEAVIDADSRLRLEYESRAEGGKEFRIWVDQPEDRHLVARLGTNGPILDSATVRGITIYGVSESGAYYGQQYEDGSRCVETAVAQTRVFPDVQVQLRIIVAGVMFKDGTLVKTLHGADFDKAGLAEVYFVLPPGVQTSNCHVMRAYQGETLLGEY
jgi:hypothetical protein